MVQPIKKSSLNCSRSCSYLEGRVVTLLRVKVAIGRVRVAVTGGVLMPPTAADVRSLLTEAVSRGEVYGIHVPTVRGTRGTTGIRGLGGTADMPERVVALHVEHEPVAAPLLIAH